MGQPPGTLRRATVYGTMPVLALAATIMLETGERGSLSQAADGIQAHFGVSDFWIGALPSAMAIVGVIGSIPFGHLADHRRRTYLLAGAMAFWTLVMGVSALATTFVFLFVTRLGVGIVEANGPASISLISDYYPVKDRAKSMGLYSSGGLAGGLLGLGLSGVFVDLWGWRSAFWMWIPIGIGVTWLLLRQPEPARGEQDSDFHDDLVAAAAPGIESVSAVSLADALELPEPTRVGTLDYDTCDWRQAYREIGHIRSMWFGVIGITVSQGLLAGLQFWAIPFFKEYHGLSASEAGGMVIIFGIGAALGVISGGFIADRLLLRGILNARIYVVVASSLIASVFLLGGLVTDNLVVTMPLMVVAGFFITLPIAPTDALLTDVVVAPLRGRAAALRAVVRSLAGLMPLVIGILKGSFDLRVALMIITPLYAIGGLIMLIAAKTYPTDLAFVVAESRRLGEQAAAKRDEDAANLT